MQSRVANLKSKFESLKNDPAMNSNCSGAGELNSTLAAENSRASSYQSQYNQLTAQAGVARNSLAALQNKVSELHGKINGQQALVSKIASYLNDYAESNAQNLGDPLEKLLGEEVKMDL